MGQKIHPTGLRLGITQPHLSRWFADPNRYPTLIAEDYQIRSYIEKTLNNAGIADILIDRKADQVDLEIRTARPGVVVGRGGSGIEQLRQGLVKHLTQAGSLAKSGTSQIRINVVEVARVDAEAPLIAEYIAQQIERRVSFRRVVRQAIQRAQRAGVEGIKVQIGGRLNGAEIARTEWVREGRVPLHTLRADIDYSYKTAQTIYGVIGIKVWIFKGEIISGEEVAPPPSQPRRRQQRRPQFEDRSGTDS
ncbi:30S ribosomal protein S3 [Tumidithrix helvetica PCC 7403]|uniref:30S ribosomal protein S3 n=1 Tax=Tumidithrix helvetica TaxID=3457545 RepID=UPI003CA4BBD9